MSSLRMTIHSKNINLIKLFSKVEKKLNKNDFYHLLGLIDKDLTE
jgi:hypothetical protein